MLKEEVEKVVLEALVKGRLMRALQKEYFKTRQQRALEAAKRAEAVLDEALDEAAYAWRTGERRPKQGELGL